MSFPVPKPKRMTANEVVLSRDDWERLVSILREPGVHADEDDDDIAAVMAARQDDARFAAQVTSGRGAEVETTIPLEILKATLNGTHPIRAWRHHRGMTQVELSCRSHVGRDLIAQLETRRKRGSIETLSRLANTLGLAIDALIEADTA